MKFAVAVRSPTLADLPNISFRTAEQLQQVGIVSVAQLRQVTALGAWRKLNRAELHPDSLVLFALEGALRGIPWTELPTDVGHTLLQQARTEVG